MPDFDLAVDDLLARRPPAQGRLARELIALLRDLRPDFSTKVATGWGTVNFSHSEAGFVCSVFPSDGHVSLIFQQGKLLDSPLLTDDGTVKQVRWIPFRPGDILPVDEIAILLAEAIALRS